MGDILASRHQNRSTAWQNRSGERLWKLNEHGQSSWERKWPTFHHYRSGIVCVIIVLVLFQWGPWEDSGEMRHGTYRLVWALQCDLEWRQEIVSSVLLNLLDSDHHTISLKIKVILRIRPPNNYLPHNESPRFRPSYTHLHHNKG